MPSTKTDVNDAKLVTEPQPYEMDSETRAVESVGTKNQIDTLTALRFFAAAMIVVHHVGQVWAIDDWVKVLSQGVSFFFVLSGFVLTYVYSDLRKAKEIGNFFLARFARIWPACAASIFLGLAVVPGHFWLQITSFSGMLFLAHILTLESWIPIRDFYFGLNPVCWSISTEGFFYCCFPLFIRPWRTGWVGKILLCLGIRVVMLGLAALVPTCAEYFDSICPLSRLLEFVVGMATGALWMNLCSKIRLKQGVATIMEALVIASVAAWIYLEGRNHWRFVAGSDMLFFAVLIFVMALQSGMISKVLSRRSLVWLGEISYSIYLVHYILLEFLMFHKTSLIQMNQWVVFAIYCATVVLTAHLMWILVEKPCRSLIRALPGKLNSLPKVPQN